MTSRTWFPTWLVIGCAWFFSAPPIEAQTAAGQITGLVKDPAGAPVPGATVTVTETRTNLQRVVVSTSDGVYTVPSLPPGEYRLDLELSGFRRVRHEGIRLATGETARIDFDLAVGTVQEQVTVIGDAPVVREATASLGTVVENQQVVQLPLNGRMFIMLAAIANAQCYGGGMKVAPMASIDDGMLDLVLVKNLGKLDFLRAFPSVFKGGHMGHKAVGHYRAKSLRLEPRGEAPFLIDGELTPCRWADIEIVPSALHVVAP